MEKLILTSPAELQEEGFEVVPAETLLDTQLFKAARSRIERIIDGTPELARREKREYQLRYAAMGYCRDRNLWAHEQGLGKTYETILLILLKYGEQLKGRGHKPLRRGTIQIVAPRHTLKLAWLQELKTCGLGDMVDVVLNEQDADRATKPIWLLYFDLFKQQSKHGQNLKKKGKMRKRWLKNKETELYFLGRPMWRKLRQKAKPHMLVLDEVHNLREGSERTETMLRYARGIRNILALTGTPIDGWVSHLATILGLVYGDNSQVFPWSSTAFTKRFTRERVVDMDYATGEVGADAKKRAAPGINPDQIPEFRRATIHLMHRLIIRDPEVTGVKFPPVNYHLVSCPMDPDHMEYYYRAQTNALVDIQNNLNAMGNNRNSFRLRQNVLGSIQTLRRAASCPWSIEMAPYGSRETAKITETVNICRQMAEQGRKVIVFTNFIGTGKPLVDALRIAGLEVTRIYAEDKAERPALLTQEAREERIEDFLEDPRINVLVGNLTLLSTGLTMVQASVIINHDHDWRANTYRQGISRVVRPGQVHSHVDVYDLVTERSVDVYIHAALMRKLEATAQVVDGQFVLADDPDKLDVDPLSVAKALISGDFAIESR